MMKKAEILSQEFKLTFAQDADCLSTADQFLTIKTNNGGGGDFFVIETERWSFDSFDELIELFNKFKEKHEKIKEENL